MCVWVDFVVCSDASETGFAFALRACPRDTVAMVCGTLERSRFQSIGLGCWIESQVDHVKSAKITTRLQRQARSGNQWHKIQSTSGRSNTIPTRQHPELGQAPCARMNYFLQRATVRLEESSQSQNFRAKICSRSRILRFERVYNNTPCACLNNAHHCYQSHATHRFQNLVFANPRCAEKHITIVSHPFLFVIHSTDTDGTVYTRNTYHFNTFLVYDC